MVYAAGRLLPSCAGYVGVPGNHDWCEYEMPGIFHSFDEANGTKVIEIDGIRIGGFRGVPDCGNPRFEWSYELEEGSFSWLIAELPQDIDILVVHSPPHGVLDKVNSYTKGGR